MPILHRCLSLRVMAAAAALQDDAAYDDAANRPSTDGRALLFVLLPSRL
jgi:hypothetical protein